MTKISAINSEPENVRYHQSSLIPNELHPDPPHILSTIQSLLFVHISKKLPHFMCFMKQYTKQSSSDRYEKTMSRILTDKLQPQGPMFSQLNRCRKNTVADWWSRYTLLATSLYHIQFYLLLQILVCCQEIFLQQRNFI